MALITLLQAGFPDGRSRLTLGRWCRALLACLVLAPAVGVAQDDPDTLTENYRDWVLICQNGTNPETSQTDRNCEITQELREAAGGQRILRIAMALNTDAPGNSAALTLVTPFGVRLADGVSLTLAEDAVARASFLTCLTVGCIAKATLSPDIMDRLAQAETVTIGMVGTSGDQVQLEISLQGLSSAWRRLTALTQE